MDLRVNDGTASAAEAPVSRWLGQDDGVRVTVDAGVWIARLTGSAQVGAGGTDFALNEDLAVGGQAFGVAGEFAVWCGRWRFGGIGLSIGLDDTDTAPVGGTFGTTAIAAGDTIRGDYSLWMAGGEVGYTVWRPFADEPWPWSDAGANRALAEKAIGANGRPLFDMRVVVLGGALVTGYDQTLDNLTTGSSSSFSSTVGAVYAGGGAEFDLGMDNRVPVLQDVRLYTYAGFGPTIPDGNLVWMVRVGLAAMLTPNVGVEFGYRLFDFYLEDGPSEVDAGVRGIFAAVSLKF